VTNLANLAWGAGTGWPPEAPRLRAIMPRLSLEWPPVVSNLAAGVAPRESCPSPPAQLTKEVITMPTAPPNPPLDVAASLRDSVPPPGTFPATVHYSPAQADTRAELRFDVEWHGGRYTFTKKLNQRRPARWLAHLRSAAGLTPGGASEALEAKRVGVEGEPRLSSGKLIWWAKRYLKMPDPEPPRPAGAAAPPDTQSLPTTIPVQPNNHDALADLMLRKLESKGATFFHDGENVFIAWPNKAPIPIVPGSNDYAALQIACTNLGTVEYQGRILTQRVAIRAMQRAAHWRRLRFSFADADQVLVPVAGGKLLRIAADGFSLADNGTGGIWLEHPKQKPVEWDAKADPREGLEWFDKLLVRSLAVPSEPLRSLLAVTFGMLPFLRQRVNARPILELTGQTGMGKSTGAERFLRFYAVGPVQGDYSLAQAKRDGDVGMIVRDNVETENLTRSVEDYFLFAATGGEWARVGAGRAEERPIVAVTSLEGIGGRRPEINRRLICFEFQHEPGRWLEESILADIDAHRTVMFRGIAEILRSVLRAESPAPMPATIPMPDFTDYCALICRLLCAWQDVAGKCAEFADEVFRAWDAQQHADELEDSAGVYPRLLDAMLAQYKGGGAMIPPLSEIEPMDGYRMGEWTGRLYKATPNTWLTALKAVASREREVRLPSAANGLGRRLKELKPRHGYLLVTEKDDKETLARHGRRRLWGILEIGDDSRGAGDD